MSRLFNNITLVLSFLAIINVYGQSQNDIKIGTQVWKSKNLDVTSFRNGDPITEVKSNEEWRRAAENKLPVYCYYNFNSNNSQFGKLYNWYAVIDARGLAPLGYHIPTEVEWKILIDNLGGDSEGYSILKEASFSEKNIRCSNCTNWSSDFREGKVSCNNCEDWSNEYRSKVPCHVCKDTRYIKTKNNICKVCNNNIYLPNENSTNGFNAKLGGYYDHNFGFRLIDDQGYYWTSSQSTEKNAWAYVFRSSKNNIGRQWYQKDNCMLIRLMKD